ncbi:MAG: hypothetical protein MK132_21770 [Lentisphaerales bacterium]|nr:hypothetical protein [Lentisphaerales bacterium]
MELKLKSLGQDNEEENKPAESLEEKMKRAEKDAAAAEAQQAEKAASEPEEQIEVEAEATVEGPVVEKEILQPEPVEVPAPALSVKKKPEPVVETAPPVVPKTKSKLQLADKSMTQKKADFTEEPCGNCGAQLREGDVICTACGTKVGSSKKIKGAGQKSSKGGLIFLIIAIIAAAVGAKLGGFI